MLQEESTFSWIQSEREVSSPQRGIRHRHKHLASAKRARSGPSPVAAGAVSAAGISFLFSTFSFANDHGFTVCADLFICICHLFDSFTLFSLHSTVIVIAT